MHIYQAETLFPVPLIYHLPHQSVSLIHQNFTPISVDIISLPQDMVSPRVHKRQVQASIGVLYKLCESMTQFPTIACDCDEWWSPKVVSNEAEDEKIWVMHHDHPKMCMNGVWGDWKSDYEHHSILHDGISGRSHQLPYVSVACIDMQLFDDGGCRRRVLQCECSHR
jgi:hypothetical protein